MRKRLRVEHRPCRDAGAYRCHGVGAGGTSAAPGDNAVVHLSGVAANAIVAGPVPLGPPRPPAEQQRARRHGSRAYVRRRGRRRGRAQAVRDRCNSAPGCIGGRCRRAGREGRPGRPCSAANSGRSDRLRRVHGIDSERAAKDGGKAVGAAAAAGMLIRTGDHFDDVVPYVQPPTGPACSSRSRRRHPFRHPNCRCSSAARSPMTRNPTIVLAARSRSKCRRLRGKCGGSVHRPRRQHRSNAASERMNSPFPHTTPLFFQFFNRTLRELATARGLNLRESARLLGYVNVATADTMIACWEAKYHYYWWRPNHAIQRADTDGNPATSPKRAGCRSSSATTRSTRPATPATPAP